ncbi:hypothetical protein HMPREF1250_2014 [Megasphaera vaginalis (ex Srinivasan et al. 2021)]|uniref:Uncharacterized protein n=1 Tax=Megasphaera vaginalis (ex Srinivasan et al. 2021) TaxID=1111454 RepID=U7URD7_9FIRM|nr:hypothetical protein HMPREF1250_2014 [Megasphaera vaginalis (ex Srinivasan et al. 2021)]
MQNFHSRNLHVAVEYIKYKGKYGASFISFMKGRDFYGSSCKR